MKNQKQTFVTYVAIICALILTTVSAAQAATFTVNSAVDSHDTNRGDGFCDSGYAICSLRAAIEEANSLPGDDHIQFSDDFTAPNPPKTIFLKFDRLWIESNITINGPGARQLMIDGNQKDGVFSVSGLADQVSIYALTIQNGYVPVLAHYPTSPAGIDNFGDNTLLSQVTIRNNIAVNNTPGWGNSLGGGIGNFGGGSLTLLDCTVSGNKGAKGGGIHNQAYLYVINSTISDNTSGIRGGGIYNYGGAVWIRNTTITNNFAQTEAGGGIYNLSKFQDVQIANTIVANNSAPSDNDIAGSIISLGNNLVRDRGSSSGYVASDLPDGTNPELGALKNNGGPTNTRALISGSPAINAGNDCILLNPECSGEFFYEQRGVGFPRKFGRAVDIGAYEYQGEFSIVQIRGKVLMPNGRGLNNAVVTLTGGVRESRSVETDQHGNFSFDDVRTGERYVIKVESRQYDFAPQELFVTEERDDVNFVPARTAEPPDTE